MKIVKISFLLYFVFQWSSIGSETIEIRRNPGANESIPVWFYEEIRLVLINDFVENWLFNNRVIVEFNGNDFVTLATSPINATGLAEGADSVLRLRDVNQAFTGVYQTQGISGITSLNLIVHNLILNSVRVDVILDANQCKAFLLINDSIDPTNTQINRKVNSSALTFAAPGQSQNSSFQIINGSLSTSTSPMITIEYSFLTNNFQTIRTANLLIENWVRQPTVRTAGTPNNCLITIQHNLAVVCVESFTYCLNPDLGQSECRFTLSTQPISLMFPINATIAHLQFQYQLFFIQYSFDINVTQCLNEDLTSSQPNSSSVFPMTLTTLPGKTYDTITTFFSLLSISSTINNIVIVNKSDTSFSEVVNETFIPLSNVTDRTEPTNSFPGWAIGVIVGGGIFTLLMITTIIIYFVWRHSKMKSGNGIFHKNRIDPKETASSSTNATPRPGVTHKAIPQTGSTTRSTHLPPLRLDQPKSRERNGVNLSNQQEMRQIPTISDPRRQNYVDDRQWSPGLGNPQQSHGTRQIPDYNDTTQSLDFRSVSRMTTPGYPSKEHNY